ncbi:hypothetical protein NEFER03_0003 [Nematocida sp. LUAm3]|nr:hypothetical protein NEFER03_0003 [Nematocida sp. LUAm3]KAI5173485.1 hypothetical protein NEFER02_0001 [Nematocida sp. LUAm2]KAI5176678.1 hypothetical protein NEFER01_0003 [Nematocida sp. LUAm1]
MLQGLLPEDLSVYVRIITAEKEKRKERIHQWGDAIDMQGSIAPSSGPRVIPHNYSVNS